MLQFALDKRSILPVGDISEIIADEEADIAVLEEPEHLTWYHHGKRWKSKFCLVIGIIHTNYLEYVKGEKNGRLKASLLKHVNSWVVGIYCHKVLPLSDHCFFCVCVCWGEQARIKCLYVGFIVHLSRNFRMVPASIYLLLLHDESTLS